MSITGHVISIKDAHGNWVEVPAFYESAYQAYTDYCVQAGKTPVSIDSFYSAFNLLADSDFLNTLAESFAQGGVLGINVGGTNATNAEDARANLNVYGTDEVYTRSETDANISAQLANALNNYMDSAETNEAIADAINELPQVSLESLGVSWGSAAPNADTPGTIYFQI
jgi:hypothetical protein